MHVDELLVYKPWLFGANIFGTEWIPMIKDGSPDWQFHHKSTAGLLEKVGHRFLRRGWNPGGREVLSGPKLGQSSVKILRWSRKLSDFSGKTPRSISSYTQPQHCIQHHSPFEIKTWNHGGCWDGDTNILKRIWAKVNGLIKGKTLTGNHWHPWL